MMHPTYDPKNCIFMTKNGIKMSIAYKIVKVMFCVSDDVV